jgi:hypothetical protein
MRTAPQATSQVAQQAAPHSKLAPRPRISV